MVLPAHQRTPARRHPRLRIYLLLSALLSSVDITAVSMDNEEDNFLLGGRSSPRRTTRHDQFSSGGGSVLSNQIMFPPGLRTVSVTRFYIRILRDLRGLMIHRSSC